MNDKIPAVFENLTAASPLDDLCVAAYIAAANAAREDMKPQRAGACLASDDATIAYLRAPSTRSCLEDWLQAYRHDEGVLTALSDDARTQVLASAWRAYEATVMQARDAARAGT